MTEKRPSSVRLGSRPSALRIRSYSLSLRPCWASSSGVTMAMGDSNPARASPQFEAGVGAADPGLAGHPRHELVLPPVRDRTDAPGGVAAEGADAGLAGGDGIGDHRE